MKTFVCGDLHGEITLFEKELINIGFNKQEDTMICVGDLIDRGEDSLACLRLLQEPWFKSTRGNHEQMAIDAIKSHDMRRVGHWRGNGGDWYYNLDLKKTKDVKELLFESELPLVIEVDINDKKFVICHADYPKDVYSKDNILNSESILWNRVRYLDSVAGWCDEIEGADMFYFGHTIVDKVCTFKNQTYIDTGAVSCGKLSVLELK